MKKSKILLGKAGILKEEEEEIEVNRVCRTNWGLEDVFFWVNSCTDTPLFYL